MASNLIDAIERAGHDLRKTGKSDEYIAICPTCGKKKLYINPVKRSWVCFVCATGGGIRTLCELMGIQIADQQTDFARLRRLAINRLQAAPKIVTVNWAGLPEGYRPLLNSYNIIANKIVSYLQNRGVTQHAIARWRLGYCVVGPYAGHLIIPISDKNSSIVSFQARRIVGEMVKGKNPGGGDRFLFGVYEAQHLPGCVLVEGPFDAMAVQTRLEQHGIGGVALLGTSCSQLQAWQIARELRPEICWVGLDPDVSESHCHKVGASLRRAGIADVRICAFAADPDEIAEEALLEELASAVPTRV